MAQQQQDTNYQSPIGAAFSSVGGWIKGGTTGLITGGVAFAAGAALVSVATQLIGGGDITWGMGGVGGEALGWGVLGGLGGGTIGAGAGTIAGFLNSRRDKSGALVQQQEKQVAYAQGLVQGATMAKVEHIEQEQESTKWRDMHPSKHKEGHSHVQAVQDQTLASMEPQGRA